MNISTQHKGDYNEDNNNKTDKQNKYQELANDICSMWKQKAAQVIPIVI
jgi:hypothetical protein